MKIYRIDNLEFAALPAIYANTSPITEAWWLSHGGTIQEVPDPPEPEQQQTISKYAVKMACEKRCIWGQVRQAIEDAGKWESFLLIQSLDTSNAELQEALPLLVQRFGQETVDAVLAEATDATNY